MGVDHADFTGAPTADVDGFDVEAEAAGVGAGDLPLSLPFLVVGAELAARLVLVLPLVPADPAAGVPVAAAFLVSPLGVASFTASLLLLPPFSFCGRSRQFLELLPLSCSLSLSLSCLVLARADWTVSQGPSSSGCSAAFSLVEAEAIFSLDAEADPEGPEAAAAGAGG